MLKTAYTRGCLGALEKIGILKVSSDPEMGDALFKTTASATGQSARNPGTLNTADAALSDHDQHVDIDPHLENKIAVDYESVKKLSPVPVHDDSAADNTGGAFYSRHLRPEKGPFIGVSPGTKDPNRLAHEIGHAQFDESTLGRMAQHPAARALGFAGIPLAFAAGWKGKTPTRKALGVSAAVLGANAPVLLGEGAATYKGHRVLEDAGATPDDLSAYRKGQVIPQSSYLSLPLIAAGTGLIGAKLSSYKLDDRITFRGLSISVENKAGSYRHWTDSSTGEKGKTLQRYPYGYVRMSEGLDGDHVDCYIGPNHEAENVYVVTTNKPPDFKYIDEQKCMLGFDTAEEAKRVFLQHYDDPRFFNNMKTLPFAEFKTKVLATKGSANKKIASNMFEMDHQNPIQTGPGSFTGQVPGDSLALPMSSLVGMRSVVGDGASAQSKINKAFIDMDQMQDVSSIDGNSSAYPSGPSV